MFEFNKHLDVVCITNMQGLNLRQFAFRKRFTSQPISALHQSEITKLGQYYKDASGPCSHQKLNSILGESNFAVLITVNLI